MSSRRFSAWTWIPLAVAVVTYLRSLGGGFLWDDWYYLHRSILGGQTLYDMLFPSKGLETIPYYRPVSHLLGYALFTTAGEQHPWVWHAANIALHVLGTLGVHRLLRWFVVGGEPRQVIARSIGATAFAVWPAHVEAIAWVSARTEVLMVVAIIWGIVLHLQARDSGKSSLPAAALFLAALLSKEVGVVFIPIAVAATILLPPLPGSAKTGWRAGIAPSLWLAPILAYLLSMLLRSLALTYSHQSLTRLLAERLKPEALDPAFRSWGFYVREGLLLGPGAPYVEFAPEGAAPLIIGVAAAAVVIGLLLASIRRPAVRPWAMAASFFTLALGPPIAMAIDPLTVTTVAMRYLYLADVGIAAAIALVVSVAPLPATSTARTRAAIGLAVAIAGLVAVAQVRIQPWLSARRLWERALADNPRCTLCNLNLSIVLLAAGEIEKGTDHLRIAAYAAKPLGDAQRQAMLGRLAEHYISLGDYTSAKVALRTSSRLPSAPEGTSQQLALAAMIQLLSYLEKDQSEVSRVPRDVLLRLIQPLEYAAASDPLDSGPLLILATLHNALGEWVRARHAYEQVAIVSIGSPSVRDSALERARALTAKIDAETDPVKKHYFAAQTHELAGRLEEAIASYEDALELAPERSDLLAPLAELKVRTKDPAGAVALMERATKSSPENAAFWFNLGLYRVQTLDAQGADDAFAEASRLAPKWWRPYFQRGLVLDTLGRRAEAIEQFELMLAHYDGLENYREVARYRLLQLRGSAERPNSSPVPRGSDVF